MVFFGMISIPLQVGKHLFGGKTAGRKDRVAENNILLRVVPETSRGQPYMGRCQGMFMVKQFLSLCLDAIIQSVPLPEKHDDNDRGQSLNPDQMPPTFR